MHPGPCWGQRPCLCPHCPHPHTPAPCLPHPFYMGNVVTLLLSCLWIKMFRSLKDSLRPVVSTRVALRTQGTHRAGQCRPFVPHSGTTVSPLT